MSQYLCDLCDVSFHFELVCVWGGGAVGFPGIAIGDVLIVADTSGKASSPPPALNDNRQPSESLDTVLFQLRQVTRERDELRKRLALASPGTTFDDCRYASRRGALCKPLTHSRVQHAIFTSVQKTIYKTRV